MYVYHSQSWVVYYCFTRINHQVVPQKVGNGIPIIIVSKKNGSLGVYTPFSDKPKWRLLFRHFKFGDIQSWNPMSRFSGSMSCEPNQSKEDKSDWTSLTKLVYSKMGGTHEYMLNPFPKAIRLSIAFTRVCHGFWMIWWLLAPGLVDLPPCKQMGLGLVQWPTPPTTRLWKMTPYIHIWIAF